MSGGFANPTTTATATSMNHDTQMSVMVTTADVAQVAIVAAG